jgi:hypothetical protein
LDDISPHQTSVLLVYLLPVFELQVDADDVNVLGGSVYSIRRNTEALVVASNKTGLEVDADKTKNIFMSRHQNTGRRHHIKINKSSFERVEDYKYLETTLTYQNST